MEKRNTDERSRISEIIKVLADSLNQHGDIRFYAILSPNLEDNDYTIGMRQHKETGVKEAFIETIPAMSGMMESLLSNASMFDKEEKPSDEKPTSQSVTCEATEINGRAAIKTSDDEIFYCRFGGCGEAIYVTDSVGGRVTEVPTSVADSYKLHDEDVDVICAAINGIKKK